VVAGAMIGGGVGAVVGLGVGAGAGAVWWLRRDRQQTLPKGTEIVFMLDNSMQLGGS
jgi:outer membrane lipoprotein SlyB